MSESILTSINLAGGSFNVYYDTILDCISASSNTQTQCPSGWKAAILISYSMYINSNTNSNASLVSPIPMFNIGKEVIYYGTFIYESSDYGTYATSGTIRINSTDFTLLTNHNMITSGTIIFMA